MGGGFDSLTALADAYKMDIVASVAKTTKSTDEKTQAFVGDCIKMVRFCADDNQFDNSMMDGFLRTVNKGYGEVIKQLKDPKSRGVNTNKKETQGDKRKPSASSIPRALQVSRINASGKPGGRKKRIKSMSHN